MNGIFGLFNLNGAPVASEQLTLMKDACAFWGVDGTVQWSEGDIGLGCLRLISTPEAVGEQLPLHNAASGLTLTAGVRLDNRDELLRLLDIRSNAVVTDGEILLHAYRQWGQDCVHHLEGDWHFAIWDPRERTLFLARDHQGNTGLYYYRDAHSFAFASSKKALLALDVVPKAPDLLRIAQVLTACPGDGVRTGYERISQLPPAHRMTITRDGAKAERYWFLEDVSPLRLGSDDEYVEAFLEVFTEATSARLRTQHPVAATLSGGLDSGSVTAVAAKLASQRGQELVAYTSVPLSDPGEYTHAERFGDESRFARATVRQVGGIEHHLVRAENTTPLQGIERTLEVLDEPVQSAANEYWIMELLAAVRARGSRVLLTGQGGNATISWVGIGDNLLPVLLNGGVGEFRRAFETTRRDAAFGFGQAIRRFLLRAVRYEVLSRWSRTKDSWQQISAIRPEFARTIGLRECMAEDEFRLDLRPPDPMQRRLEIIRPGRSVTGTIWSETAAAHGLEARDPTQDRRVMELCLAMPETQFMHGRRDRWLIRRAMQGYLPDEVRWNTRRGLQAADMGRRVLENRAEVDAALDRLKGHDLAREVLDLPRMVGVRSSLEQGLNPRITTECGTVLLRGLMAGQFLLRF